MIFRVGQKVVCVDASPGRHLPPPSVPLQERAIYTIRGFDPESQTGLYLEEIPDDPPPIGWKYPRGFRSTRFRPVVERKTDISIFTRMLTPAPRAKERSTCASS